MDQELAVRRRQSDELAQAGEWGPKAEAVNRRLIELAPSWAVGYTRLAKCLRERGDLAGAAELYRRVLTFDPDNVIAGNKLRELRVQQPAPAMHHAVSAAPPPAAVIRSSQTVPTGRVAAEEDGLAFFHERLAAHFEHLQQRRMALAPGRPIFALEHGLTDNELTVTRQVVQAAIRRGHLSREAWLPYLVYATEIGYEYSGDEYWPIFEERTPGWRERGDRNYIRDKFRVFQKTYGGATPTGTWAEQFSIICWPITHAVLPSDLQVQLARLLFEYRRVYTSDLLADPSEFGKRLASRAWQASSRFRNFVQNTDLLGHVAAAMLLAEDESSPYLLDSTLHRIIADLEQEKQAKRWLYHARQRAGEIRTTGLHPLARPQPTDRVSHRPAVRLPTSTDPVLSVQRERDSWAFFLEVPDLSVLADRLPTLTEELARKRALISGYAGAPLARGQLLFPGRRIRLSHWPAADARLIQLEDGSPAANSLLAEQCVISPGPPWLFRLGETEYGVEVRGKFCRADHSYILLTAEVISSERPPWLAEASSSTDGMHAYLLTMPAVLTSADLTALQRLGIGTVTDVAVKPAGFVPALWAEEGVVEWLTGDEPTVMVTSSRAIDKAFVTLDDRESVVVHWPPDQRQVFIRLDDLGIGSHELRCSLLPADREQPMVDGLLDIIVRAPATRPTVGTYREGLMILATPANPTLGELWDGRAALEIRGPTDVGVTAGLTLKDRSHRSLGQHRMTTSLPMSSVQWASVLADFRESAAIHRAYEAAEIAVVSVSHPSLGEVSLACEREFAALRWAPGSERGTPFVRLINNTEVRLVEVDLRSFARPDVLVQKRIDEHSCIRESGGGLVRARAQAAIASVILPPTVRELGDLRGLNIQPSISESSRAVAGVRRLIELSRDWDGATLPADPFASRQRILVLRAIRAHLGGLIGGENWSKLERACVIGPIRLKPAQLQSALGGRGDLSSDLLRRADRLVNWPVERRVQLLAGLLASRRHHIGSYRIPFNGVASRPPETRLAEFILRLASAPASILEWPADEIEPGLRLVLEFPILFRLGRLMVLETAGARSDMAMASEGWVWD